MSSFASILTLFLALGTIASHVVILAIIVSLVWQESYFSKKILPLVKHYAVLWSFIVALSSLVGSLIYSDIIGFDPCTLCWIQRIFIYPQILILGFALWRKDPHAVDYCLWFSIIGGVIALYQSVSQLTGFSLTACTSVGESCAKIYFLLFGYITLPVMSFTAFVIIALLMFVKKVYRVETQ